MQYDEFIGQVQDRARVDSRGEALKATRATLETLAERLAGNEPGNLGSQLPEEVAKFVGTGAQSESFGLDEFFKRVSKREEADLPVAAHHARAVVSVLQDAVAGGEIDDVKSQLPDEFMPLFESGSEGKLNK